MPRRRRRRGTFLVAGADSEVGSAVLRHLESIGQPAVGTTRRRENLGPDRAWLDLADFDEAWEPPAGTIAACICAARSRLADCAADPVGTWFLNVDQTTRLVTRLAQRGIYTLFLSSNQVFNGEQPLIGPRAPLCPVSEYGRQKAAAEGQLMAAAAAEGAGWGVLRLSRVLGPATPTIANWARSAIRGEPIRAFTDMVLAPVPIEVVAGAVYHLLAEAATGIFQLSGARDVTYAHFGRVLLEALNLSPTLVRETLAASLGLPIGSVPSHTTLESGEIRDRFGLRVPDVPAVARSLARELTLMAG